MYSLYVFLDRYTKPIVPPLVLEKDYGRYIINENKSGRVCLVRGNFEQIFNYIKSHNEIYLGFHDSCIDECVYLEKWVLEQ